MALLRSLRGPAQGSDHQDGEDRASQPAEDADEPYQSQVSRMHLVESHTEVVGHQMASEENPREDESAPAVCVHEAP